jgi:acetylornithine deacetylase/succinyl-diaminopimelate desuccinylase-like protein
MQEIEQLLDGLRKEYADFNAVARKVFERPPLETNPNQPIVQALRQAAKEVTGVEENVVGLPYWTDGAILADSRSVPTCIFGPGDINVAHSPDEYVEAQQVQQAANIYAQVVGQFCA